jgi:quercetin dioxygenase-like cupin family protein
MRAEQQPSRRCSCTSSPGTLERFYLTDRNGPSASSAPSSSAERTSRPGVEANVERSIELHRETCMTVASRITAFGLAGALLLTPCGSDTVDGESTTPAEPVVELLAAADQTILGQPIEYPSGGAAEVTVDIITLQPGDETGWHHHNTPMVAVILDGTITVDYGDDGSRTYATGEAILEAVGTSHNGSVVGDEPARILVVNLGAAGIQNTVAD